MPKTRRPRICQCSIARRVWHHRDWRGSLLDDLREFPEAMSSADGPLGLEFAAMRRIGKEQPVFLIHQRLAELEQPAGLTSAPSFRIRRGFTNMLVSPSTKRSSVVRFGARFLERLLIRS